MRNPSWTQYAHLHQVCVVWKLPMRNPSPHNLRHALITAVGLEATYEESKLQLLLKKHFTPTCLKAAHEESKLLHFLGLLGHVTPFGSYL